MPEISDAEKAGMSFEERCREALGCLQIIQAQFELSSTQDVAHREGRAKRRAALLAALSPSAVKEVGKLLTEHSDIRDEMDGVIYKTMWEWGIDLTRKSYGGDAVDFALETLKVQRSMN